MVKIAITYEAYILTLKTRFKTLAYGEAEDAMGMVCSSPEEHHAKYKD